MTRPKEKRPPKEDEAKQEAPLRGYEMTEEKAEYKAGEKQEEQPKSQIIIEFEGVGSCFFSLKTAGPVFPPQLEIVGNELVRAADMMRREQMAKEAAQRATQQLVQAQAGSIPPVLQPNQGKRRKQ